MYQAHERSLANMFHAYDTYIYIYTRTRATFHPSPFVHQINRSSPIDRCRGCWKDGKGTKAETGGIAVSLSATAGQRRPIVNIAWCIRYFGGSDRELWWPVWQT